MKYLTNLKNKFNTDQLLVLLSCFSLTFPFYICGPILVIIFLYLLFSKKMFNIYQEIPKVKYLFIFLIVISLVSLSYQNWVGLACCIGIYLILSLMLYYRVNINSTLFEYILDMLICLSVLWAMYATYEQIQIYNRLDTDIFSLKVFARRENRINSVFFNANYYAMMLEFIIMMIIYKFLRVKNNIKKSINYVVVGLINLVALYYTGCRTAFITIVVAAFIFLIINKNYKLCVFITLCSFSIAGFYILNPSKFPRIEYLLSNLEDRMKIWTCAIKGIKAHPLLGQGPMTYMMIYEKYGGHVTQHAHSAFLDPILSFGVIGVSILIPYIVDNCHRLYNFFKEQLNRSYIALVLSFITVVLVHGILDYTIFFLHTGLLFLFVVSSFDMYKN